MQLPNHHLRIGLDSRQNQQVALARTLQFDSEVHRRVGTSTRDVLFDSDEFDRHRGSARSKEQNQQRSGGRDEYSARNESGPSRRPKATRVRKPLTEIVRSHEAVQRGGERRLGREPLFELRCIDETQVAVDVRNQKSLVFDTRLFRSHATTPRDSKHSRNAIKPRNTHTRTVFGFALS